VDKVVGVLGGLGPEATKVMFERIIEMTPAQTDSEHIRVIIDSNPKIPDRTQAILHGGESPVNAMSETARTLQGAGANFIIIPCMTAHFFRDEVAKSVDVPILDAFGLVAEYITKNYPTVKNVGVIATSGSIKSGLYNRNFENFTLIVPDDDVQEKVVMELIYGKQGLKAGVKNKDNLMDLDSIANHLRNKGAEIIIAGCTEIGIIASKFEGGLPVVDPLDVLAMKTVEMVKGTHS